jgi:restriction system protein
MRDNNVKMWGIRAGKGGEAHQLFIEGGIIALEDAGLGNLHKLNKSRDSFYAAYRKIHSDETRAGSAGIAGKFFRFLHQIMVGDLAVYPATKEKTIYIGEITGDYTYLKSSNYPHRRSVRWTYAISKGQLSKSAQYELGAARTFFELKRNKQELLSKCKSSFGIHSRSKLGAE